MFKIKRTRLKTEKNLDDQDRATSRSGYVLCFGDEVKWWLFCFRSCKFAVARAKGPNLIQQKIIYSKVDYLGAREGLATK